MAEKTYEVNFDGIVGPSHNYSGLSYGNIASTTNKNQESNPRLAALQGLEKMKFLTSLGVKQAVLPPHERPHIPTLRRLGFTGTDDSILDSAYRANPQILYAVSSSAAMWTANAATVCPSVDAIDKHVHFTPANLSTMFHRSIEAKTTETILKKIFHNRVFFTVHSPLPSNTVFDDEGAANHMVITKEHGTLGLHIFVYGRSEFTQMRAKPSTFPARQTREASEAIARLHTLYPKRVIYTQQNPKAIDAGAFHNDVVAVANQNFLFMHESSFLDYNFVYQDIKNTFAQQCDGTLNCIYVYEKEVPLATAIKTYLFNSQIITLPTSEMIMIAPKECQTDPVVHAYLENLSSSSKSPINHVYYFDLRQSMQNGGGPACLRLRVPLNETEIKNVHQPIFLDDTLYKKLFIWIEKHYRDKLRPIDLIDPLFLNETRVALDELTKILELGPIYSFQNEPLYE